MIYIYLYYYIEGYTIIIIIYIIIIQVYIIEKQNYRKNYSFHLKNTKTIVFQQPMT